jgi:hypothetical protein
MPKKSKQKEFKVYYFKGDYFSSAGEQRYVTVISADTESDAEHIFKKMYSNCSFGWVEEIRKEK